MPPLVGWSHSFSSLIWSSISHMVLEVSADQFFPTLLYELFHICDVAWAMYWKVFVFVKLEWAWKHGFHRGNASFCENIGGLCRSNSPQLLIIYDLGVWIKHLICFGRKKIQDGTQGIQTLFQNLQYLVKRMWVYISLYDSLLQPLLFTTCFVHMCLFFF